MNFSSRSTLTERMLVPWRVAATCAGMTLYAVNPASAERLLVNFMDYRVLVSTGQACTAEQEVTLQAPDDVALLRLGETEFASGLFAVVGAVLQVSCAAVETITLSAHTIGTGPVSLEYRGRIMRGEAGWQGQGEVHVLAPEAGRNDTAPTDSVSATQVASSTAPAPASAPEAPDRFLLDRALAATGFDASGFRLPGLIAALHLNRPELIPDDRETRHHMASIFIGADRACQRRDELGGAAATRYASSLFGPQEHPFAGVGQIFENLAGAMQNMQDPLAMMDNLVGDLAFQTREGLIDGEVYAETVGCRSLDLERTFLIMVRLFRARGDRQPGPTDPIAVAMLWSPEMREFIGLPDPLIELAARERQGLVNRARGQCIARFSDTAFCGCLAGRLAQSALGTDELARLGERFALTDLQADQIAVTDAAVRACLPAEVLQ